MPYSNYFDNPYLNDAYLETPDYSMNTFFDADSFFNQSLNMESSAPKAQPTFNPTLPATGIAASSSTQPISGQMFNPAPFGKMAQYTGGFPFDSTQSQQIQPNEPDCFYPTTGTTSQAPSLCGDAPLQTMSLSLSPHLLNHTSPAPSSGSDSESSTPKRLTRMRGRPRPDRSSTDTLTSPSTASSSAITKTQRAKRLPHNQVERKYREGLNSELERLRRAVPMLSRGGDEETGAIGQPKPSKAMVLSSAIDYIHRIERERDALNEENDKLRQNQRLSRGEDMDRFLMDQ
jgi:hypothetical protein